MFVRTAMFAVLVLGGSFVSMAKGQEANSSDEKLTKYLETWLPSELFREKRNEDNVSRLLKERFRSAAEEAMELDGFGDGYHDPGFMLNERHKEAESRVSRAVLELCQTSSQRTAALQRALVGKKAFEALCAERVVAGIGPAHTFYIAQSNRLDAEIELSTLR